MDWAEGYNAHNQLAAAIAALDHGQYGHADVNTFIWITTAFEKSIGFKQTDVYGNLVTAGVLRCYWNEGRPYWLVHT